MASASYDFIENSVSAYRYVWNHSSEIARLAAFPVFVKFCCTLLIFVLGFEEQYLRQGLILIPAYFVEGAFLIKILQRSVAQDKREPYLNPVTIRAALVLYVLIKVVSAFAGGLGMGLAVAEDQEMGEPSPFFIAGMIVFLVFLVWSFRLLWLYIPLALGYSIVGFLKKIRGMSSSFVLIGSWLMAVMPLALVLVVIVGVLGDALGHSADNPSEVYRFILIAIQSVIDLLASLLVTLAIGFGVREVMEGKEVRDER